MGLLCDGHLGPRPGSPGRPRRPLQLRRWLRQLEGRLECAEETMVLQHSWQGLSREWGGLGSCSRRPVRLQCGICELGKRLVSPKKELVLPIPAQGVYRVRSGQCCSGSGRGLRRRSAAWDGGSSGSSHHWHHDAWTARRVDKVSVKVSIELV